ncbi:MAG: class II aldolase/adducin family protein [Bacteroidota bacterium]|nr:class II aldolase/adducin family protein [Bacteroidota bacterium]
MTELEGITKYDLYYTPSPPLAGSAVEEISRWRQKMVQAKLIGQDPDRYSGYGFGNISCRLPPIKAPADRRRFVITGSQTGHKPRLTEEDFAIITSWDLKRNRIKAHGPVRPSSESLTHAVIYSLDARLRWVIHVHSPELWRRADGLQIPQTRPAIAYGTVDMAREVERLFAEESLAEQRIFAMGGHEDGLVAFGRSAAQAAEAITDLMDKLPTGRGGGI